MTYFGANPYTSSSSRDSYDGPISFARVGDGQFEMVRLPIPETFLDDDSVHQQQMMMIEALGVHQCPHTGRLLHAHQTVGHPAAPMWSQFFEADKDEDSDSDKDEENWELKEQDAQEELEQYKHWLRQKYLPPVGVLAMNQADYGMEPSASHADNCKKQGNKQDIIPESLMEPEDRAMLHKAQMKTRRIHAVGTGLGAAVGFGLGGPVGAAVGGASGNAISSQLYPTPNRVRNIKTVANDIFWGGLAGGLSPVLIPSGWAALAGGALAGYYTS